MWIREEEMKMARVQQSQNLEIGYATSEDSEARQADWRPRIWKLLYQIQAMVRRYKNCCIKQIQAILRFDVSNTSDSKSLLHQIQATSVRLVVGASEKDSSGRRRDLVVSSTDKKTWPHRINTDEDCRYCEIRENKQTTMCEVRNLKLE